MGLNIDIEMKAHTVPTILVAGGIAAALAAYPVSLFCGTDFFRSVAGGLFGLAWMAVPLGAGRYVLALFLKR